MNIQNNEEQSFLDQKDFWESLQMDILTSNQNITLKDCHAFIERSFMFSLFFRGCPGFELAGFQEMLGIGDYAYVILLELIENKSNTAGSSINEFGLHYFLKKKI
jgi:hypothetical protein